MVCFLSKRLQSISVTYIPEYKKFIRWQTAFVEKSGRIIWSACPDSSISEARNGLKEAAITWWQLMAKPPPDTKLKFDIVP